MQSAKLSLLRLLVLLFFLPGIFGLALSAITATRYLATDPKLPEPDQYRMVPRSIQGVTVYLTDAEDIYLTRIDRSSILAIILAVGIGLIYLEQWGKEQTAEQDRIEAENLHHQHMHM